MGGLTEVTQIEATQAEIMRAEREELMRYRDLFDGLEALLTKTEHEHLRLNRYAGMYHAGIKDTTQKGCPIFRFKAASVLEVFEHIVAGVGE